MLHKLKRGRFQIGGQVFPAGEPVDLTESQAKAWADLFDPVREAPAARERAPRRAKAEKPAAKPPVQPPLAEDGSVDLEAMSAPQLLQFAKQRFGKGLAFAPKPELVKKIRERLRAEQPVSEAS